MTYMTIGAIVGTTVTVERLIRLRPTKEDYGDSAFWIGTLIGEAFNCATWPLAIVAEIYELVKGE